MNAFVAWKLFYKEMGLGLSVFNPIVKFSLDSTLAMAFLLAY